jgi:beta-glucanase (GH16 family)
VVLEIKNRITNYKKMNINYLFIIFFAGITSCKKPVPPAVTLPSNLQTTLNVTNGTVDVSAQAENANFYTMTFYHGNDSTVLESQAGTATHVFTSSGTYTIKTKAHATYADYISKTDLVQVTVSNGQGGQPSSGYTSPLTYPNYTLVWQDEFNGSSLSSDWTYDIGTGSWGWGNNELQYYTNQNAIVANGVLEIKAKQEQFNGQAYTSSRIKTQGLKSWKYGRVDIRAALPYGQGMWPALWMLGDNITSAGWPACGEIDIMEMKGGAGANDRTTYGTIHWQDNGTHAQYGGTKTLASGKFADEFHVFSIVWDQVGIHWLLDNVEFKSVSTTPAELSEFQEKFFLIFNVAVGGNFAGNPDGTTVLPQSMYVDYVRVFQ